ncbi:hypothetical protein HQN60_09050 [Deefgea piscis]|uniref:RecF/RecN/SMC N-terminal domain-containing protein n=1 Tax=Deefgea piscis TaxID=2739061 RepID=A0A6M8SNR7_9NEIS|nr:hypothetical protein [Deefgea piscis]QKJ66835.1 hypothetical protein HQN60_09050 [Deefgea piscis]
MKIKKVEIEGFRAYKLKKDGIFNFTIDGVQPSNFIAIYAPNGFGKSSFYDAVEWALTNNLERYLRDQNKRNNEQAAKSTKISGVPQYILRNKDAEIGSATSVTVSTTKKTFTRSLGTIRHDSRDFRFSEQDTEKNSEVFRSIILSQDGIDRFLREVKPQERYVLFMESFGGESEQLRREITALRLDNFNLLDELQQEITHLETQLLVPVDESIFDIFNSTAMSLNKAGESVKIVARDFSAAMEHEILAAIVTRIHELNAIRDKQLMLKSELSSQLSRLPEIQHSLDSLEELKPRLVKLQKGVEDSQRNRDLHHILDMCVKKLQLESQNAESLSKITAIIPNYIIDLKQVQDIECNKLVVTKKKDEVIARLTELDASEKLHNSQILATDKNNLELRSLLEESDEIYKEISSFQFKVKFLENFLIEKTAEINGRRIDKSRVEIESNKLSNVEVDIHSLLSLDINILNLDEQELFRIKLVASQLNSLEAQEQNIRRVQETVTKQMGLVEHLVQLGLEYVSAVQTDVCPLCQTKYSSSEALKAIVEGNLLVSELGAVNAKELEEFKRLEGILKKEIDLILTEVQAKKTERNVEMQTKLADLGEKISVLEHDRDIIKSKIISAQQRIADLHAKVLNLNQEDLVHRLNHEIKELACFKSETESNLVTIKKTVAELKVLLSGFDGELSKSSSQVQSINAMPYFFQVGKFIEENSIAHENLKEEHSRLLQQCLNNRDALVQQKDEVSEKIKILHEIMLQDGSLIEFGSLVVMKEAIEQDVVNLELKVNSFFVRQKQILSTEVEYNLDLVRTAIVEEIEKIDQSLSEILEKNNKFDLLQLQLEAFKLFFKNLASQKSLTELKIKQKQHLQVQQVLESELDVILAELHNRIDSFFYADLINAIYSKIDPHPSFKKVEFTSDFSNPERPGLNIVVTDEKNYSISPNLYFSAAQLNILSLSVFLARALHAKDNKGDSLDVILIDDPIQSMDSINVLATIDLLRNISLQCDKQIIISTHDENFFGLLQKKIPSEIFDSKFLKLKSFGVVTPVV